ncbi:Ubiquitin domain-containing protein 2 [Podila epicladia]|nr:Ubiquitin domain-containing protein 2 [Podila epicladia]KAG0091808.1 Ubiquitin domain-containing protein 2 [Podila epicladia]
MQALKQHKWTSPTPLTRSRLEKEREEFWDTSPNYGGRAEVWQVLRAACEEPDHSLVQAILDAGRITVPSNRAAELTAGEDSGSGRGRYDPMAQFTCFDHLGNMYVIPVKCLSAPSNLVENGEEDGATQIAKFPTQNKASKSFLSSNAGSTSSESTSQSSKKDKDKDKAKCNRVDVLDQAPSSSSSTEVTETVRLRLSNVQKETLLKVPRTVSVGQIKEMLLLDPLTELVPGTRIRIFFLGRILEDKERLQDVSHFELGPQGTVLQVQASIP